ADPRAALTHIEALTTGLSRKADIQRHLMPVMLGWFAAAPDPDAGLLAFRRTSEALGDSPWYLRALRDEAAVAENVATALASSRYVVDQLQRDPTALQLMIDPVGLTLPRYEEVIARMRQAARRQDQPEAAVRAVRELRRRELLRIAITELLGKADIGDVGAAIAAVTSATITVAVELLGGAELLTVIAMGRWGGAEMSYGSDADVLFVADDVAAALPIVTSLRTLLAAPGIDTPLILDAGLRPEGKNGPLVRTPASYATYYATWSAPWEAQALLRARTICGDGAVLEQLDPVRYPAGGLSTAALAEMRSLKVRMETERMPRGVDPKLNLKFGPGGLVDVEWAAQLLQRRHAGAYEQLRSTSTRAVLSAGAELGLIDAQDAQTLMDAWRLASRVRNAIMLSHGRASDQVPTSARELARVAALVGYERGESSTFLNDYLKTMRRSRMVADRLLWD
ncbi:MAG: bifunctional [glutamine synthetase] adenylyltransferase/[glutamine synthetase]-adenylyl-L-tyrosine phosphorylase, partial [Propionibacteriaceae bacterium]